MGVTEVSENITKQQLKLSSDYNSTVDLLQLNIINNKLFETKFRQLKQQAVVIDDLNKLLNSFDIKQRSQIINLEKANEILVDKKKEGLVKQRRRIFMGIALFFIVFISFYKRQLLLSLDKRILFAIPLLILILTYLNRSLLIESFETSNSCSSKKQIDIVKAFTMSQFHELAKDLIQSEESLDKLKNPPSLFTTYSNSTKFFNKNSNGEFNLSC
jgi:hypothetical protein